MLGVQIWFATDKQMTGKEFDAKDAHTGRIESHALNRYTATSSARLLVFRTIVINGL